MRRILILATITALSVAPTAPAGPADGARSDDERAADGGRGDRVVGRQLASRGPVIAKNGMVTTSHPLAAEAGLRILRAGGSAVDAAIATNAVLGVVEPVGGGIGGDLFAIVWDPRARRLEALNASGASPLGLTAEALRARLGGRAEIPLWGALPVTVPGAVDGWFELHRRFGRLPMRQVLAPAIEIARQGHPVAVDVAFYLDLCLRRYLADLDSIEEFDNFRRTFLPGGALPRAGQMFRNPDLASTYEELARHGRASFYEGRIARTIDAYMRRIGGHLTLEDLRRHRSEWVTPLATDYRGYRVYQLPPNSQGLVALQMLNILERFPLATLGHNSAAALHLQLEAKKLAFVDRARFIADPRQVDVPVERLLSEEHADSLASRIDRSRAARVDEGGMPAKQADTVYLATADATGMMVSLIQSNFQGMGSGLVPDGLGFVLQDRGAQFDVRSGVPNSYAPGKRPFHTIMPGFVMKGDEPYLAFGVIGGDMQPQAHAQILSNLIDFGLNVQEAGDAARVFHSGDSQPTGQAGRGTGVVHVESGIAPATIEALRALGHEVRRGERVFGAYQGILFDARERTYWGAADSRLDGQAVGY